MTVRLWRWIGAVWLALGTSGSVLAASHTFNTPLDPTPAMAAFAEKYNAERAAQSAFFKPVRDAVIFTPDRPFADYEDVGYLIISAEDRFSSLPEKLELVKNLPSGVTAVILTEAGGTAEAREAFGSALPSSRIKYLEVGEFQNAFWARDSIPIPVWQGTKAHLALTGARYYHGGGSDNTLIANLFQSSMNEIDYYNEGGNFEADERGNCLLVHNARSDSIPDSLYTKAYGCHSVTRLAHLTGIGHVDEVVRLLPNHVALTDQPSYQATLESLGFKVGLLPQPDVSYGTYANALVINQTVYLPVFADAQKDAQATALYEKQGFHVVPLSSTTLSSEGRGSIHCITMTYPKAPMRALLAHLRTLFR